MLLFWLQVQRPSICSCKSCLLIRSCQIHGTTHFRKTRKPQSNSRTEQIWSTWNSGGTIQMASFYYYSINDLADNTEYDSASILTVGGEKSMSLGGECWKKTEWQSVPQSFTRLAATKRPVLRRKKLGAFCLIVGHRIDLSSFISKRSSSSNSNSRWVQYECFCWISVMLFILSVLILAFSFWWQ